MKIRRLFAILVLGLVGCGGTNGEALSVEELGQKVKHAYAKGDLDALCELVCWDGVDPATRVRFEQTAAVGFEKELIAVEADSILATEIIEEVHDGVQYRPNMRPVGRLLLRFREDQPPPDLESYVVGVKEGVYLISSFSPAPRPGEVAQDF